MTQWYHSGIEGYCKAAAQMMGLPDNNSGWGNFGSDLFADGRFDDPVKASKTWTLSRFRKQGRSNRPTLFEKSWLDASGNDVDIDAIHACARSICDARTDSALLNLYQANYLTFATGFRTTVIPAIEDGFRTERYHSASIARFTQGLDMLLGELNPSVPQTFRNFVIPLVAGLVYGPGHIVAQANTGSATFDSAEQELEKLFEGSDADTATIRLTQLFSDTFGFTGYSELFDEDTAVFLGRNAEIASYLEKCNSKFAEEIIGRNHIVFPIAGTHKNTSKEHGVIACIGNTWYFHDFSSNGSYVENAGGCREVHDSITALIPGDRICLGQTEPADNSAKTHHLSTMILASFNVNESVL